MDVESLVSLFLSKDLNILVLAFRGIDDYSKMAFSFSRDSYCSIFED